MRLILSYLKNLSSHPNCAPFLKEFIFSAPLMRDKISFLQIVAEIQKLIKLPSIRRVILIISPYHMKLRHIEMPSKLLNFIFQIIEFIKNSGRKGILTFHVIEYYPKEDQIERAYLRLC